MSPPITRVLASTAVFVFAGPLIGALTMAGLLFAATYAETGRLGIDGVQIDHWRDAALMAILMSYMAGCAPALMTGLTTAVPSPRIPHGAAGSACAPSSARSWPPPASCPCSFEAPTILRGGSWWRGHQSSGSSRVDSADF